MRRSPLEPVLSKQERKTLATRLRAAIASTPMDMRQMADVLEVEPEAVVVALRELRASKRGTLRSAIRLGHVAWWWEVAPAAAGKKPKKKRK